ncbi:MAG: hypothetical protein CK431_10230 [Mycobacterium sp.]|nr:MAG: hypothetical protein CK431_10230 [Mycobacterium sp.]
MISTKTTAQAEATLEKGQTPVDLGDLRELVRATYSLPNDATITVDGASFHKIQVVDTMYVRPFLTTVTGGDFPHE